MQCERADGGAGEVARHLLCKCEDLYFILRMTHGETHKQKQSWQGTRVIPALGRGRQVILVTH